jgi:ice-binding like protein/Big-like domain-containing protein
MMKRFTVRQTVRLFFFLLSGFVIAGCGDGGRTGHWLPGTTTTPAVTVLAPARPTVLRTIPVNAATGVFTNTKITATFSKGMNPLTIDNTTFMVTGPGLTPVPGTVLLAGTSNSATFTPASNFADNTLFTATITTGAQDLAGNALAGNQAAFPAASAFVWTFRTGVAALDNTAPTVTLTFPADNATGVATNSAVNATFSEAMDPLTIDNTTFTVQGPLAPIAGTVAYNSLSNIATFTPAANLADNTSYTATITIGATDLAGNALVVPAVGGLPRPNPWTFTTGIGAGTAPGAVPLGSAGSFGIMATSAITNTGLSRITGDVSLNPGTSMTGFPPGVVIGSIHVNDSVSVQARADLLAAYNFAKTLPPGTTISGGADLGALYPSGIPPGTYTSGSTMLVSTPLVLDAGGNANAVWVFQIGSSLTTGANVSLANGADPRNVFWVPTLDATIGVGTTFHGTIVSGRDVTAVTGATINGRILAGATLAGTIALQTSTVTVPQ